MAEVPPLGITRAAAIELVSQWLTEQTQMGVRPLEAGELARWSQRDITHGWRLVLPDSQRPFTLDLFLDSRFPFSRPRVAWHDAPAFPNIPHVEEDGLFCVLPSIAEFDRFLPVGIVKALLGGVGSILEQGLSGSNFEDFRTEFLSYWNPLARGPGVLSILDPSGPSRPISIWRGRSRILAAENSNEIRRWLLNAHGKSAVAKIKIEPSTLIWLDRPILPDQYPRVPCDLGEIAGLSDPRAAELLEREFTRESDRSTVLIGADAQVGVCFAAVHLEQNKSHKPFRTPVVRGFRTGKAPASVVKSIRSNDRLTYGSVERGDAWWIHGRDGNADLIDLLGASVGIIGCGSLGAPVARYLTQAGVGNLKLVDDESLVWANVGRHVLGAQSIHMPKATALADQFARDFPHLVFDGIGKRWQVVAQEGAGTLADCDLLISTIGSWAEESELNYWLLSQKAPPPTIFAWSEPRACGGHAVLTGGGSGCLSCGLTEHGEPRFKIIEFAEETLEREAACGAYFQAYGASQIALIATLVADLAIDVLCERASVAAHRMVSAREKLVRSSGGTLTQGWIEISNGRATGGNMEETVWPPRVDCRECGGRGI